MSSRRRLADPSGLEPTRAPHRRDDGVRHAGEPAAAPRAAPVADAFCATRLDGDWGRAFGTLPAGIDARAIVDRARIACGNEA
jgi:hypothetical protein